ncbi:PaaI family thioesterase [Chloroflexota bacterium]
MENITQELRTSLETIPYSNMLGFRLIELREGYSKVSVKSLPEHSNYHGWTDGSLVMSLADYASVCASNSLGRKRVAVQININFLAGAAINSELIAEARAIHAGRTTVIIEMTVTDSTGKIIARASSTIVNYDG